LLKTKKLLARRTRGYKTRHCFMTYYFQPDYQFFKLLSYRHWEYLWNSCSSCLNGFYVVCV